MADLSKVYRALKHYFGFDGFKDNQEKVINSLLDGHDVFVLMPTGGGKSLCYQLPALMQEGTAVVISPLIALMKNQVDSIRHFCTSNSVAHFLNSSLNKSAIDQVKRDVTEGRTKLLYVAPESLTKYENVKFLQSIKVSFFAVDEAHCISEWGHDFRPEYRKIRPVINAVGERPVIALTATATPKVQHDIQKNLGMTEAHIYKSSFNRPNLFYGVVPKTKDVDREIIHYIKERPGKSGIIYCLSRKKVEELSQKLQINDVKALPYHAGMDTISRSFNQDAFLHEKVDVIVATIAFGMGIDKPDVRYVIHYDIPKSLEGYYQETGRAGRDGGEGECITFYTNKDLQKLEKLMQGKPTGEQEIGRQLLIETASYAESSVCRRKILLHYFGETFEEENCGSCDNCLHPKKRVEATDELLAVIEAVLAVGERHRSEYLVNVLIGRKTDEVRSYGHQLLDEFGSCEKSDEKFLATVIRQAVIEGYLTRDIENYGILRVTDAGHRQLEDPKPFTIVEDVDFSTIEADTGPKGGGGCASDPILYAILKDQRKATARRLNLPPYVIFQDPSLEAMATNYPITIEELRNIPGVGAGKARRYGSEFVKIIAKYVEENEVVRPVDMRIRTVADKSRTKISIIQGVDRKVPLDELARSKGLEFNDFLSELEAIVLSGTQLNLDYYLSEIIDEDIEEELIDFLRNQEDDDIDAAMREFGEDLSDDEIRLVRVKFLSEMGN